MKCTGGWGGGSAIGPCPEFPYNTATNQISYSGFSFDAAGNILTDSESDIYTWDAEGRMAAGNYNGSTVTYTYNALGQRVERSGSSVPNGGKLDEYYDAFGARALIINSSTSVIDFLPSVAGRNYVKYQASATFFMHTNPLGSVGLITSGANSNVQEELFYPWGMTMTTWQPWGGLYSEQFASLNERDPESTLDTTPNRTYWWGYSRWLTPDPLAGDITNPQSLNRYAYVMNNPLSLIDPFGLSQQPICLVVGVAGCGLGGGSGGGGGGGGCSTVLPDGTCIPPTEEDCIFATGMPGPPTPGGGGGGGGGGTTARGSGASQANGEDFMGQPCIQPSLLTRLTIFGGMLAAKILSAGGTSPTKSVSWGVGGSVGGGAIVGGTVSVSYVDTVDIYGNAAQVTTLQAGPAFPALGLGGVAGIQLQKSSNSVPTTPQYSAGPVFDSTISVGGGFPGGWGANYDSAKSGTKTLTLGWGAGGKAVSTSLLPVFVISGSIPYCR